MTEDLAREALAAHGRSLFDRGYSSGTSGNLSVRLDDGGLLVTPTNVSLGRLEPGALSRLERGRRHVRVHLRRRRCGSTWRCTRPSG
jgi:3-dehydro-4-phosphotetronate decarboxylase